MSEKNKIPEINIKLKTITVTGGKPIKMTVRNMFYVGFFGKLKTLWHYYWYKSETMSWKSYLNQPVTYKRELNQDLSAFHSIDAEVELTKILEHELKQKQ